MDEISFGTSGWRATLDTFTTERLRTVAQAVADYLTEEGLGDRAVAVGYDARPSSPGFAEDVADVLAGNGFDVVLPERDCPTPLAAYSVVDRDLAGALVISASHNPPEYNGVKFFPEDAAPAGEAVTDAIEARLAEPETVPESDRGTVERVDFVEPYADHVFDLLAPALDGESVVYDAMHGSGRGVTDDLLGRAGASVEPLRCEIDPEFGGTPPEPSAENLGELAATVREGDADLGIANDGDADRIAVVTPERGYLDENLLFAAVYDYLLEAQSGPAVRTVSTTFLIDRVAEAHDEAVIEVPVGFKYVAAAIGEHDALMGGEESGGFSIRGHVREKDGVMMALLAAAADAAEPLDDRVDRLFERFGEIHQSKLSVDCPDGEKARVIAELGEDIPDAVAGEPVADVVTADGFKLLLEDGSWLLVRPSGTEPKMRVYAEGPTPERVEELLAAGRELVEPLV